MKIKLSYTSVAPKADITLSNKTAIKLSYALTKNDAKAIISVLKEFIKSKPEVVSSGEFIADSNNV